MKKLIIFLLLVVALKWWFSDPSISVPSNIPANEDVKISYLVKYSGGASSGDILPMVVALHGNGDNPEHFYETALIELNEPARILLLKAPIQGGRGSYWPGHAIDFVRFGEPVNEIIELLSVKFPTKGKPILMGYSGGGMMAFYLALRHGDSYSYIIPVSGRMSTELLGEGNFRTGAKVSVFHGKSDNVVSISGGKRAVELLKEEDVEVEFTPFNGGHLGIFREMRVKINREIEYAIISAK